MPFKLGQKQFSCDLLVEREAHGQATNKKKKFVNESTRILPSFRLPPRIFDSLLFDVIFILFASAIVVGDTKEEALGTCNPVAPQRSILQVQLSLPLFISFT